MDITTGEAAFTLSETLLLLLLEKGVFKADEITQALEDCVDVHRTKAASEGNASQQYLRVADRLERLLLGRNLEGASKPHCHIVQTSS